MRFSVYFSILFLNLFYAFPSFANFVANDTQNFNPVPSGLDFVTVHGSQTLVKGAINIGIFLNQAANVLPPYTDSSGLPHSNYDRLSFGDLSAGYGLTHQLEVGLNASYLLNQQTDRAQEAAQFSDTGMNELRLGTKYNFLSRSPVGAAMVLSLNMSQSTDNPFAGKNSGPTFNLETVVDGYWKSFLFAANFGYRFRNKGTPVANSVYQPLPDQWIGSLAVSHYVSSLDTKLILE